MTRCVSFNSTRDDRVRRQTSRQRAPGTPPLRTAAGRALRLVGGASSPLTAFSPTGLSVAAAEPNPPYALDGRAGRGCTSTSGMSPFLESGQSCQSCLPRSNNLAISSRSNIGTGPSANRTPWPASVTRPMTAHATPSAATASSHPAGLSGATAASSAPVAMSPSGSRPNSRRGRAHSGRTGMRSRVHLQPDAGRRGQLAQAGGQAALGGVVHGVDPGRAGQASRGSAHHADAGIVEEARGSARRRPRRSPAAARSSPRSRAMSAVPSMAMPPVSSSASPAPGAGGRDQVVLRHLAQHLPAPRWAGPARGVTSVCPPTRPTPSSAQASCSWREDVLHQLRGGGALGQQQGGQEPARRRADGGEVVGVDVDGVPADLVGGEGDGVRSWPPGSGRPGRSRRSRGPRRVPAPAAGPGSRSGPADEPAGPAAACRREAGRTGRSCRASPKMRRRPGVHARGVLSIPEVKGMSKPRQARGVERAPR